MGVKYFYTYFDPALRLLLRLTEKTRTIETEKCSIFSGSKVLSVILRLNGYHFAAPTQLLPAGGDPDEAEKSLEAFTEALKVAGGTPKGEKVQVPKGSFTWKEYRSATKAVLAGLSNSLRNCLPAGWSLKHCMPPNFLEPASTGCDRVSLNDLEKVTFDCPKTMSFFFNYDFRSFKATPQFYLHENFQRLIFSADEGTEAGSLEYIQ